MTPDCSSHTFRHHPGAHLHPCTAAGSSQELGHYLEPLQTPSTPSTPVISAAMIFTIRGWNPRFLDFRAKTAFIHLEENCLHRSYCFWLSADLGFTSGLHYLSATTGHFLFYLNSEFLDDAVEETTTRKTCWFAKPPQCTPVWLYREWGFSGPWALDTAQQGVHLGNKSPTTV